MPDGRRTQRSGCFCFNILLPFAPNLAPKGPAGGEEASEEELQVGGAGGGSAKPLPSPPSPSPLPPIRGRQTRVFPSAEQETQMLQPSEPSGREAVRYRNGIYFPDSGVWMEQTNPTWWTVLNHHVQFPLGPLLRPRVHTPLPFLTYGARGPRSGRPASAPTCTRRRARAGFKTISALLTTLSPCSELEGKACSRSH